MSKSVLLKSSIAKKYWMALTGLFLCLFLVGHLLGNLQLFVGGEEGKRMFNEYAYFMTHNPAVKILSYLTYISILFHAVDGFLLTIQNKKARPIPYAHNNAAANSTWASRNMALLGSIILIFIATHMVNFWAKMHFSEIPLHKVSISAPGNPNAQELYITTSGSYLPVEGMEVRNGNEIFTPDVNLKLGEGYKDLHTVVMAFFGQNKSKEGFPANEFALLAVLLYVVSMIVLSFHLQHGFASAFQSLGARHPKYTSNIEFIGKAFSVLIPLGFAIIPIYIYLTK
jgi:succinate dehydrogenase / fumarate reductase, cytochrome b subunit